MRTASTPRPLIRLRARPGLQSSLRARIRKNLAARARLMKATVNGPYSLDWERTLNDNLSHMALSDRVAFSTLRRQFEGYGLTGIPTLMRAARMVLRPWRRLRSWN